MGHVAPGRNLCWYIVFFNIRVFAAALVLKYVHHTIVYKKVSFNTSSRCIQELVYQLIITTVRDNHKE